jgi:hypothetical protein
MPVGSVFWPKQLIDPINRKTPSPAETSATNDGAAGEETAPARHYERRFQLPVTAEQKPVKQVLVRLEVPAEVRLKSTAAVPEVMLWQLSSTEKPKTETVVAAHKEEPPVRERETAPVRPQLAERNREAELARLRHAAEPPVAVPAIPLPVANTTPIRLLDGLQGNRLPNSTGPSVAMPEEVHVISVPEVPVPQARVIVLPTGNQGVLPPAGFSGSDSGSGTGPSNANGKAAGTSNGGVREARGHGGGANGNGTGAGATTTRTSGASSGGTGAGEDVEGNGTGGVSAARPLPPGTIRIDRPKNGKFTVVVLGSSNLDAYPEAAGLLSGKLVYTVYLRTGGRKEWILQYCLPSSAEQAVKVRGSAVPLEAPYPYVIFRPNLALLSDPDYLIVHGFISVGGRFERLSAIGDLDAVSKEVLMGALEHWEFRPASRDGEASAVEIALIIPREPLM